MDAINALGQLGGYVRIATFPAKVSTEKVEFLANCTVQVFIPDLSSGFDVVGEGSDRNIVAKKHLMIATIKGPLKHFTGSNKTILDLSNNQDFNYPNSYLGTGVRKFISSELIMSMLNRMPKTGDKTKDVYIAQFRVVNGQIEKVNRPTMTNEERAIIASDIMGEAVNTQQETTVSADISSIEVEHTNTAEHDNNSW